MTRIFIEAKYNRTSEYVFLDTLLKYLGFTETQYEIICVDGKSNLTKAANKFRENSLEGGNNLIIFDADTPETGCGHTATKERITKETEGNHMEVTGIFLFPDNHRDGIFENLLEELIQKETHAIFLDCYHDYEICLGDNYVAPNLKGKLFTYISAQKALSNTQRNKLGSGQWLFDNSQYWNLEAIALQPLKDFLIQNVQR